MNISLNTIKGMESDFDKITTGTDAIYSQKMTKTQSVVAVDLGSSLFSNNAYGQGARTQNDVMAQAQNTEVQTRHNYLAVMANTLSPEDFAEGMEEGFDLYETSSDETVTILDKIKATLAQSGKEIIGYTDDLTGAQLEKITGSKGLADKITASFHENDIPVTKENVNEVVETVRQMSEITELTEGAVKYMTLNDLEPTMENIYMAEHVTNGQKANERGFIALEAGGYYAQKADTINWDSISAQADRIIEEAGLPVNKDNTDRAKWMIEQSIPLTKENLATIDELYKIDFPVDENKVVDSAVMSIANKSTAAAGLLEGQENNLKKAIEIQEKTENLTDIDVEKVIGSGKELNLKNLFLEHEEDRPLPVVEKNTPEILEAKVQLQEVRLQMSISANLRLIDKGFVIDTAPINELVDQLKKELECLEKELFPDVDTEKAQGNSVSRFTLFEQTTVKVDALKMYPAAIIGKVSLEPDQTLERIADTGYRLKLGYEKAGLTYEAVGTAPRADLGDNIRKAFRNVDDILKGMSLDLNDENRRAVRILGYNRMEITEENIERVRTVDEKLTDTLERLKPQAVLKLIRDGENPLNMTLDELSGQLKDQNKDQSRREEKYAKFLYKLEKNAEITPEEKESYIGIYRLFHNLKKTDNAAIGAVLETGAEMTIGNLLTADRTIRAQKRGMDYKLDDTFGGIDAGSPIEKTIDQQIETAFLYYREKAETVYDNLEPEKLHIVKPGNETLLNELADQLEEADIAEEFQKIERYYIEENVRHIRSLANRSDSEELANELSEFEIEISAANLEALINIRSGRRGRNGLFNRAEAIAKEAFRETKKEMLDDLMDTEDYRSSYEEHLADMKEALDEMLVDADTVDSYIDVKAIQLIQKQISLSTRMADRGSFDIPVDIDGRTVSMHVTLKDSDEEGSKIEAGIDTPDFGRLSMAITIGAGEVRGVFAAAYQQSEDLSDYMSDVRTRFLRELKEIEPELSVSEENISIMYRRSEAGSAIQAAENGFSDSRTLLRMAGIFVHAL